jgi:hypothetical protein
MTEIEKIKNLPNTQNNSKDKKAKFLKMLADRDKDAIYESFERRSREILLSLNDDKAEAESAEGAP